MNFQLRRILAFSLTLLSILGLVLWFLKEHHSLHRVSHSSGWILVTLMSFLAIYNLRKKLTYPPLFKSSTWLQLHLYVAWICLFLFLFHTGFRIPNGQFEISLALVFWGVALSGLVGLILTRTLPNRLRVRGDEVIYERIPIYRRQLKEEAEQLIIDLTEKVDTNTLADFYTKRLSGFFRKPYRLGKQFFQPGATYQQIVSELRSLARYLNDKEKDILEKLIQLISTKDNLDYHLVRQGALKYWLFVHIPLTYILFIFVVVHIVLVHAFYGGNL